jgi:hypothetical protein
VAPNAFARRKRFKRIWFDEVFGETP